MSARVPRPPGRRSLALTVCMLFAACASGGSATPGQVRSSSNRLGTAELEENAGTDLFTLIEQKRPRWLTPRAGVTFAGRSEVSVVIDGVPQSGSAEQLRSIPCSEVREVRYLSSSDATTQYGTNMVGGAIVVTLKR